ncbi:MAG: DEAD/DEAH box helicase [Deltaproteobacteria bacterium]|nr:DEAD/DEAH box helicase [Deltaproteobacteria bacterium]
MQRRKTFYRGSPVRRESQFLKIRAGADPRLKKVFARVGVPARKPFKPDPFQVKAIAAIRRTDCLVSAPTGSGKTWIAVEAIRRIHKKGGRAWYASPLKALSNSKYLEFIEEFSAQDVGILTGDRRENPDAPIIVGTTEILRNQLYDAMHEGMDLAADIVILDEAHFMGDEDRGVVWEEIMIYLPVRVNLLLLSATINNCKQIAGWLESIRSKPCVVVEETGRPVPLFPLFFHPSGKLLPLLSRKGVDKKVEDYLRLSAPPQLARPGQPPPFGEIIRVLRKYDLLPAIFFLKSRADCDAALEACINGRDNQKANRTPLNQRINELVRGHPRIAGHKQLWHLCNLSVAAHHSGQLPAWKLLIERLMTEGLLEAVFATSTVAAGVNFPARTVVFLNSDRYNGREFVPLNATEFHQMTGRAGRRGKDHIGFALIVPGKFMDVRLIANLCQMPPEDITSQVKTDFSMVLNLLLSHNPEQIKEIFQRSFATYSNLVTQEPGLDEKIKEAGRKLMAFLPGALCARPEFVLDLMRKRTALIREIANLNHRLKVLESRLSKLRYLVPGRLFLDRRDRAYCVIKYQLRREGQGVLACRVKQKAHRRAGRLRMRWFEPRKVSKILDRVLDLPPVDDTYSVVKLMTRAAREELPPVLEELTMGEKEVSELTPLKDRIAFLEQELGNLICNKCCQFKRCHGKIRGAFRRVRDEFALMWDTANAVRMRLWNDFVKHLECLKAEGFVSEENKPTADGIWASQLRLDRPLLIAEGLRRGLFPPEPALLAALVAPFVSEREMDVKLDASAVPKRLIDGYQRMKEGLAPLMDRLAVRGFEVKPINLWPAATVYAWANGQPWDRVLEIAGMAEGDLAMLVTRTADNLRQMTSLKRTHPGIAQSAAEAIDIILREPVVM